MTAPLAGIRVADFSRLLPGPLLTQILTDLGADVVVIENPNNPDMLRSLPPTFAGIGAGFHALNRGKRSFALDLRNQKDLNNCIKFCQTCDVIVESFRPGVMERLGLDPSSMSAHRPGLIFCRISGYGQHGPDALKAGHDLNYVARAGLLSLSESATVPPAQIADLIGGALLPAVRLLAAIRHRDRTGQGCTIEASMLEGAWSTMLLALTRQLTQPDLQGRPDWLGGEIPSYNVYQTADGALSVAALEPKFWNRFCEVIDHPELLPLAYATGEEAISARATIAGVFGSAPTAHWEEVFRNTDCCVEPVRSAGRAHLEDPALCGLELMATLAVDGRELEIPMLPVQVHGDFRVRKPAPALGEHNQELLEEMASID